MKSKETDMLKRKIINALTKDIRVINIKICKKEGGYYHLEIGDSKDMSIVKFKGSTGIHTTDKKDILQEVTQEINSL